MGFQCCKGRRAVPLCRTHPQRFTAEMAYGCLPHHKDGLPNCTQLMSSDTPCTPFQAAHRYWRVILGPACLQFAISFHNNPTPGQSLRTAVLCHSEGNAAAFQTLLQAEEQAQTLLAPSFNGFRVYFYFLKSKVFGKISTTRSFLQLPIIPGKTSQAGIATD